MSTSLAIYHWEWKIQERDIILRIKVGLNSYYIVIEYHPVLLYGATIYNFISYQRCIIILSHINLSEKRKNQNSVP